MPGNEGGSVVPKGSPWGCTVCAPVITGPSGLVHQVNSPLNHDRGRSSESKLLVTWNMIKKPRSSFLGSSVVWAVDSGVSLALLPWWLADLPVITYSR